MNARVRRIAIVTGAALAALLLLAGACVTWLTSTPAGARFAFARAQALTDGRLAARSVQGTLAGPLIIEDLAWRIPARASTSARSASRWTCRCSRCCT